MIKQVYITLKYEATCFECGAKLLPGTKAR
jgi:hypothetical protein